MESGSADITAFDPGNNLTLSCAAKNIQGPVMLPYSATLLIIIRAFQSLFWVLLLLSAASLNIFVMVLIAKYKKLQTLSFGIALQIVVLDLITSVIVSLVGMVNAINNRWVFGEQVCALTGLIIYMIPLIRSGVMFVFVVDRFLSVFCPFAYPIFQKKIAVILSLFPWLLAVVTGIVGYILDCYTFLSTSWLCSVSASCSSKCSVYLGLLLVTVTGPTIITPLILYVILFIKAKKLKKAMTAMKAQNRDQSKFDWKATITFFLLFITVFALTLPNLVFFVIISSVYRGERVPAPLYVLTIIATTLISLHPVTDPIVILRNKDVREVVGIIKRKILKQQPTLEPPTIELGRSKTINRETSL